MSNVKKMLVLAAIAVAFNRFSSAEETQQLQFGSPDEAAKAFIEAAKSNNRDALLKVFGPALKEIANPDTVESANDLADLSKRIAQANNVTTNGDTATLNIGRANWPFPIPIKKTGDKWAFDTSAGKEEILNRRIGENELNTIDVFSEYVKAQRAYALDDAHREGIYEYAQKIRSSPGKHDGLYWEAKPEEQQSPFGAFAVKAFTEGYGKTDTGKPEPFFGYNYRILTKQGDKAPGGAYDYIINGHMVAGYGLIAYPAKYDNTGVMTFIVNQNGNVLQKDLGEKTEELAKVIDSYNPDDSWKAAKTKE